MKRFLTRTIGVEGLSEKIDLLLARPLDPSAAVCDRVDQLEKHILDLLVEVSALRMDLAREFEERQKSLECKTEAK